MPSLSLFALIAAGLLLRTVVSKPQVLSLAAQDQTGPSSGADSCSGCYVVADVAGFVWYSGVFLNTATAVVFIGTGNGTGRTTSTSFPASSAHFTFNILNTETQAFVASTLANYDSTRVVNGATLTSPTAYNVFTAYSFISSFISDGECQTYSGQPITLPTAYTETLVSASGQVIFDAQGEDSFISAIDATSCSGGGLSIVPNALVRISNVITTTTKMYPTITRLPNSISIAPTIEPSSTARPGSITTITLALSTPAVTVSSATPLQTPGSPKFAGNATAKAATTASYPAVSAPLIIIGSTTITPNHHPINLPLLTPSQAVSIPGGIIIPVSGKEGEAVTVVVPTGTGASTSSFTTTAVVEPFVSQADTWRRSEIWISLWVTGLIGTGAALFLL